MEPSSGPPSVITSSPVAGLSATEVAGPTELSTDQRKSYVIQRKNTLDDAQFRKSNAISNINVVSVFILYTAYWRLCVYCDFVLLGVECFESIVYSLDGRGHV